MDEKSDLRDKLEEVDACDEKRMEQAVSKNSVNRDFYGAALSAKRQARHDGFYPEIDEVGEFHYTQEQGIKAACHAREDVTAILIIQQSLLRRLQTLYVLVTICVLLLVYIAYRVL